MLLTLRDATDDALFNRIKRVMPKIEQRMDLEREKRQERQAQGNGGNGKDAQPVHDDEWCDIHQVTMTRSKDGKGHYHKAGQKPDGKALWCRGK